MKQRPQGAPEFVSVILPAHNEERFIAMAIRSLRDQSYPSDRIEIVVADNGSTDNTRHIAECLGATVVDARGRPVGAVRNAGAAIATGAVLVFIDGDCTARDGCIDAAVSALRDTHVGAVGGVCSAPIDGTWMERAWPVPGPVQSVETEALAASCFIIRKCMFEHIGGFDETLTSGEDDEISTRLRGHGLSLLLLPDCEVVHHGYPSSAMGVLRRQFWHGRSQLQVATSIWSAILIATHVFTLLLIVAIGALIIGNFVVALFSLVATVSISIAAAMHRKARGAVHVVQLSVIWWFSFVGRSGGLLFSYGNLVGELLAVHRRSAR